MVESTNTFNHFYFNRFAIRDPIQQKLSSSCQKFLFNTTLKNIGIFSSNNHVNKCNCYKNDTFTFLFPVINK